MANFSYAIIAGFVIGCLMGLWVMTDAANSMWRSEAIERGYGLYCPNNGQWAWVGECEP